ncbi:MAG: DUF948 domain-containing protein [Armatimonadota bacterium]|nr:DUF948 domain-containing protein [Armatimonadota bacterium]
MDGLLILAVVLTSIALLLLAVAFVVLAVMVGKIGRLSVEITKFVEDAREELIPAAAEARSTLANINKLTNRTAEIAECVGRVSEKAECLLDGAYVAEVAGKVVKSSASSLLSVYEGIKQGIKTLRGSKEKNEGGARNE